MDFGIWPIQGLEVRQEGDGSTEVEFTFPYGAEHQATVRDRGRVRKESFLSRAFRFAVEDEQRAITVLRGHDPNQVLGVRSPQTAQQVEFEDTVQHLRGLLRLPPDAEQTFHQREFLKELNQGIVRGVSPGFRIPPAATVPNAVSMVPEDGNPGVLIRRIRQAVLYEMSFVSKPAYGDTTITTRAEGDDDPRPTAATLWL